MKRENDFFYEWGYLPCPTLLHTFCFSALSLDILLTELWTWLYPTGRRGAVGGASAAINGTVQVCLSLVFLLLQQPWEQVRGTNCYFLCFFCCFFQYDFYKQNTYKQILFKSYQLFCGQVCQFGFHIFISSRTGWLKQLWLADVNNCPPTQMCHCLLPCEQWGLWRWFNALLKRCHRLTSEQCVTESKTITSSQLVSQSLQHGAL